MPRMVSVPVFPSGLQSWGPSGGGHLRAVENMGRVWTEVYPVLNPANPNVRALMETINRSLREELVWQIQPPYWHARHGVGGGSPVSNSPRNLVTLPENMAGWGTLNTPILTGGQVDPFGGTAAYQVQDDSGSLSEGVQHAVTFTSSSVRKAVSFFAKELTAGISLGVEIRDSTVVQNRLTADIDWSAGVPSVNTTVGVFLKALAAGNGWYRFFFQTDLNVVHTNTNAIHLRIGRDNAVDVGSHYIFGAMVQEQVTPGPYRGPSSLGPFAFENTQNGSVIFVRGAPASTTAWLRTGDLIKLAGIPAVLDVKEQVDSDAGGGAIIHVSPPLFTDTYLNDGVALEVNPANIFFNARIAAVDVIPDISASRYIDAGMTVTWREVPN